MKARSELKTLEADLRQRKMSSSDMKLVANYLRGLSALTFKQMLNTPESELAAIRGELKAYQKLLDVVEHSGDTSIVR